MKLLIQIEIIILITSPFVLAVLKTRGVINDLHVKLITIALIAILMVSYFFDVTSP
jgi:hypothetical protein